MKTNFLSLSALVLLVIFSSCKLDNKDPFEDQKKEDTKKIKSYLESKQITATEIQEGYYYETIKSNTSGKPLKKDDVVAFYYKISLLDGTVLEDFLDETQYAPSLLKKGNNALFPAGLGQGIDLMHVGEHYRFYLPSYIAYFSYSYKDFFPQYSNFIIEIKISNVYSESEIHTKQLAAIQKHIDEKSYTDAQKQESGLYYIKTKEGSGEKANSTSIVTLKWTAKYLDGTIVASTGTSSESYNLNNSNIISGLKEGLQLMKEGEKASFILPSKLAFGESYQVLPNGLRNELYKDKVINSDIVPYSPLIYEVELIKVS